MLTAPTPASSTAALTCGHWSIKDNPHGTCGLRFHEDARTAISATAIGYAWPIAPRGSRTRASPDSLRQPP